jgi:hypothetical protein
MHEHIDRLVDFIAERDPAFPRHIAGASSEQIARLEAALARPLPAVYRQFLTRMGGGSDWLTFAAARFDIDSLIRYHEFAALPDPPGFLLIGRASDDPCYDVYLWQESPDALRVVSFPPPPVRNTERFFRDTMWRMAGSLPQLLGDAALATFVNHKLGVHKQVESVIGPGREARIGQIDAALAALELAPLWYANDWDRSYEAPGLLVTARERLGPGRLIVDVRAQSRQRCDDVVARLQAAVGGQASARCV